MQLGIIGLPQSGKTTIFNALTRDDHSTGTAHGRVEVRTSVIDVPDERLDRLAKMFYKAKTIYTKVTYADIAGLGSGTNKGEISGQLLNQLTQVDGLIEVVRCFESSLVPHTHGSVDPARDIRMMDEELILNDHIMVERKLERMADELKKGGGRDKAVIQREITLFEKLGEALSAGKPLRDLELAEDEEKTLSGFGFLSRKPLLILLNLAEGQVAPAIEYGHQRSQITDLQGKLEMELGQLPEEEDAAVFMQEFGIEELGSSRIIRASYELLGLLSFFTIGDDEVRAWTVRRGALAPEAAGAVHTDFEKGFIRAEVIAFDDLMEAGGMAEGRSKGKLRLEGKQYPVKDGDVIQIRFSS